MLLPLFFIFTRTSVQSDWAPHIEAALNADDLIEKGTLFNEVIKLLSKESSYASILFLRFRHRTYYEAGYRNYG